MKKVVPGKLSNISGLPILEKQIGKKIRERRRELGLTQQDLADKLGLSYQQIQKYETGLNRISAGRLYLMAHYLFADFDYFFETPVKAGENSKRRPKVLALSGAGIDSEIQAAIANLVQTLSR